MKTNIYGNEYTQEQIYAEMTGTEKSHSFCRPLLDSFCQYTRKQHIYGKDIYSQTVHSFIDIFQISFC